MGDKVAEVMRLKLIVDACYDLNITRLDINLLRAHWPQSRCNFMRVHWVKAIKNDDKWQALICLSLCSQQISIESNNKIVEKFFLTPKLLKQR